MPRPSKWKSKTTAIRVPEHAAEQLLAIAKQLDGSEGFVQNSEPYLLTIEDNATTERYILQNQALSAKDEAIVDRAVSELWAYESLKPDERWLLLANLVQSTMKPVEQTHHHY